MTPRLYRWLASAVSPVALGYLWWKGRGDVGYRAKLAERLGHIPHPIQSNDRVWVHAASLGEVRAVCPLVAALLADGYGVHLTMNTPSGREAAHNALGDRVTLSYAPIDTPAAVKRFLDAIQPSAAIQVELELWPQRLMALAERGTAVAIVNARLSEKSLRRYQRLGGVMTQALAGIDLMAAQTQADAQRFARLGITDNQLAITGNLKFDQPLDPAMIEAGKALRKTWGSKRPVWVAASVRDGEAETVIAAHQAVKAQHPDALLILVPRHPQTFTLPAQAEGAVYWSQSNQVDAATSIVLADTTGELVKFLAAADLAFVGGSLVPVGGHNPLEPAALGLPVLMGPSVTNFERVDALLAEAGARFQVTNAQMLGERVIALFADEPLRQTMGRQAAEVVAKHQGACQLTRSLLLERVLSGRSCQS